MPPQKALGHSWKYRPQTHSQPSKTMSSPAQKSAARKNIKKAAAAAKRKKTISHLPKATRTALGKKGAQAARRKKRG